MIKRIIDLCDYYVVIVGGRYGSVDDNEHLSYTEMEFDYALKTRKPVMGFLHDDPGKLIGDKIDLDAKLRAKLDNFRAKIEKKMVKYWQEPGDLPGQVALAIMQIRKSHPAVGWIRASEAMTPDVKAELAELRAKVRELSADLQDEQRQHSVLLDTSELEQGDEIVNVDCTLEFHWRWRIDAGEAYPSNRSHGRWTVRPTWNQVFRHLGPELMDEASEEYLMGRLSALCLDMASKDLIEDEDEDRSADDEGGDRESDDDDEHEKDRRVGVIYEAEVSIESFNDVKVQFSALGLIEKGKKRRPGSDTKTYWMLTGRGHSQLLRLRTIRKTPQTTGEPVEDVESAK